MIAEPRKGGTEPGLSAGFPLYFDRLRMARTNEKGEREILDDKARADEMIGR